MRIPLPAPNDVKPQRNELFTPRIARYIEDQRQERLASRIVSGRHANLIELSAKPAPPIIGRNDEPAHESNRPGRLLRKDTRKTDGFGNLGNPTMDAQPRRGNHALAIEHRPVPGRPLKFIRHVVEGHRKGSLRRPNDLA